MKVFFSKSSSTEEEDYHDDTAFEETANLARADWSENFQKLAVAEDFPRFASTMEIFTPDNKKVEIPPPTDISIKAKPWYMYHILVSLTTSLYNDSERSLILDKLSYKHVADNIETLNDFLEQTFGSDSPVISVLKACNQSLFARGANFLRSHILKDVYCKDYQGKWKIVISVTETSILVTHIKWEEAFIMTDAHTINLLFPFEWKFTMTLTTDAQKMASVSLSLVNIDKSNSTDRAKKIAKKIEKRFVPHEYML